jgi:Eco57I restriction-modification methylase/TaqI-like C-terminal specificity domain
MAKLEKIEELIERFDNNREAYLNGSYNEAQIRHEFIDPFFMALGWDVNNSQGYAEAYKDVIHEDSIRIGSATKAPDYCFRIGGTRKFFVEAKKPSINLKDDTAPAFQLRRYAWSAKLPLSVLTDFEEFAIYDCRIKPLKNDKPGVGRTMYFKYTEYLDKWEEIAGIFSRDAILKGSFDKYADSKRKRGTQEVDSVFLDEIENWRDHLARNIALRNGSISNRELNFAVQRIIDRTIFLRICEDRGIEQYGRLQALLNGTNIYKRLVELFYHADDRYNSGLFHFNSERGRGGVPDDMTPALDIDDKILKEIIKALYHPSPYEFSVFPAEILGQVYEQFLGKVITLTAGHRAKVEEKPEVKKAGGVYYTPSYIVDYIVENTVGKLLEKKSPNTASKLTILDPACGSGSFLIGAYQYLLDWHLKYYIENDPEKHAKGRNPRLHRTVHGDWHLTTSERKRILLNNIYGVDIDTQAVEVTKLSLLLKVLEGETRQSIENQLSLLHERALPDLGNNIKCGNSLIGPDFYDGAQLNIFDDEERYRINVFDWETEFKEIIGNGGFDAVIGNPPYIPIEIMTDPEKEYYQGCHQQLERKYDSSIVFIISMLKKLAPNGRLGFISSLTWQTGENYSKLREYLFTNAGVIRLVNLPFDVFKNAYVDTGIYILAGAHIAEYSIYRFPKKERSPNMNKISYTVVPAKLIVSPDYKIVLDPCAQNILLRASSKAHFVPLGEFTISTQGLAPSRYTLQVEQEGREWYPFLVKGQVYRYAMNIDQLSKANLGEHQSLKNFYENEPKILIRRVINRQDRLMATYFKEKLVFKKDINPFVIKDPSWNCLLVLGILNSKLISYLYVNTSSIATKDDFRQTTLAELRRLPIPSLSLEKPQQKSKHDKMVGLVEGMLGLHKKLAGAKTGHEKTTIQRQIDATDRTIDKLVYELYELTDDEIKIVEESLEK